MSDLAIDYGLLCLGFLITLISQIFINYAYSKYSKVISKKGLTGYMVARNILDSNNLENVKVLKTSGKLTDHYDPGKKVIKLSSEVYESDSIASVAVAAHECGHALQDKDNYLFLRVRNKLVPLVNFASKLGYISIVIGLLASLTNLIWLGIIMELVIVLFQVITLPVEINASKRALKELDYSHVLSSRELSKSKVMLTAAALTYVASVLTSLLQIARLVLLYGKRED